MAIVWNGAGWYTDIACDMQASDKGECLTLALNRQSGSDKSRALSSEQNGGTIMMKRIKVCAVLLACLAMLFSCSVHAEEAGGVLIENGMAMPMARYTDAQSLTYTNADSDLLRFVVYVETDYDTDLDGKPDLIKTMVQLPRQAAEGVYQAPVIYEARPYIAGMYMYHPTLPEPGASDFDESSLYAQPAKRIPKGTITTLELADQANPADWYYHLENDPFDQQYLGNLTAYDYYLIRGFAIVQSAGLGTWGSEGIECCASDLEAKAFACVIEWLTGKRSAYTDLTGEIQVEADWCCGRIGMTGRSYAGAMAFEVASLGVEGLETVVPVAGPASWYDYVNSQGVPSGQLTTYDFAADLAMMCASRFPSDEDGALQKAYEDYLALIRDQQIALQGDYGPFWAARDYLNSPDFKASALIVQGLNDDMVHPKQFELMRGAFLRCGCEVKCLLHQNGHVTPANEQTKTDIMIGDHTYTEWLNLWFTYYLMGVDNEIGDMPDFTVQSNVDGTFFGTDQWMNGGTVRFAPQDADEHTVSAEGAHMYNDILLSETFDGESGANRLVWAMDAAEELTIDGVTAVHLRVRTSDVEKNTLMLGAALVDQADEAFACFDVGGIGVLDQQVITPNGVDRGEGVEPYDLVSWQQVEKDRKIIAYGSMDLRNPEAGYLPESAARREEGIEADTWYDYVLYLQPAYYTVSAGHRLELYIVPFCGFSDDGATYDSNTWEELEAMGLSPETLVPVTRDYSFTVDDGNSYAEIPVVQ